MMEKVKILNKYEVYIGANILSKISELFDLGKYSKVIVIVDDKISASVLDEFEKIVIPSGEGNKNIETVQYIWEKLLELKCDRKSLIINLGGGVIGDMGGFAAATFMRGVDFLQVPTTVLAQVDASVGGKLGINFGGVKNLVGMFNQPIGVICDISFFKSLPKREFNEGFGEIIKHGVVADKEYFNLVSSKKPDNFSEDELIEIIKKSIEVKKEIIEGDITEKNRRRLVNFGHTVGHALESISLEENRPLLHGEAVSIGMVAESKISFDNGLLSKDDLDLIITSLENADLPVKFNDFDENKIISKIKSDKKSEKGVVYFTLIKSIGNAESGYEVSEESIRKSLQFIKS